MVAESAGPPHVTHLKHAPELSSDVAVVLAKDASAAVAVPMLEFSEALSDEVLIDIVRTQGSKRQTAVASRPTVSPALSWITVMRLQSRPWSAMRGQRWPTAQCTRLSTASVIAQRCKHRS